MEFEIQIIEFLQSGRSDFWDSFFQMFTRLGSVVGFVALLVFFLIFDRKLCLTFAVSYGYELFFVSLVKGFVRRVRPYNAVSSIVCIGGTYADFSFPSGHTALATTIAIFLAYFLWKKFKSTPARVCIAILCSLFVVLIGISRMYLGVHYLTDLLGGLAFGIVFSVVGIFVMKWFEKIRKRQKEVSDESKT